MILHDYQHHSLKMIWLSGFLLLQLFRGDPEAFPGQPRDIVSPTCPGSSPGSPPTLFIFFPNKPLNISQLSIASQAPTHYLMWGSALWYQIKQNNEQASLFVCGNMTWYNTSLISSTTHLTKHSIKQLGPYFQHLISLNTQSKSCCQPTPVTITCGPKNTRLLLKMYYYRSFY